LALAAAILLPMLDNAGFVSAAEGQSPANAIDLLRLLYAGVPCLLKLAAIFLLWRTNLDRDAR
jgi:GPH family glycoside/pentoside/hexuronide:cation symporter